VKVVKINSFLRSSLQRGFRANVLPKSSIPIGAKVEISPNSFALQVKAEIEKNFSICLKY
jgi:hypothetical protein